MSKTIAQGRFIDLLPSSISGDVKIQGAAEGVDREIKRTHGEIPAVSILARIDELPGAVIDLLGWQFHVDYWDSTLSLQAKRNLVKASIKAHKYKGTPFAVETVLEAIGYDSRVIEWFEYEGDPYRFKVDVDLTGFQISEELTDKLVSLITEYKNVRSHLDTLQMSAKGSGIVRTGAFGLAGEVGTVYPWAISSVSVNSPVYSACAFGLLSETGTIYPKETT